MNKEDLLKSISNIDEKYVEAAEERRDNFAPRNKAVIGVINSEACEGKIKNAAGVRIGRIAGRKFWATPLFKGACTVAACFVLLVGVASSGWLFRGMGAAKSADAAADMEYSYVDYGGNGMKYETSAQVEASEPETTNSVVMADAGASTKYKEEGRIFEYESNEPVRTQKLVYRAFLYLQTENYDESFSALEKLVEELDGYFESQSVSNGNYYSSASKSGYCVVRIPTSNYKAFMNAIGNSWHVADKNENVSDISEQYYETQDRLETLKIKEERLHELLAEANNLTDIITLENQLSDTEYQIENLTNAMRGYDKQVDYSTIEINLDQVTQMGNTVGSEGFGKRLARAFRNGFRNFGEGIADFVVWMGYHVIQIAIVIVVIILIWKFHLIRRIINWIKR